MWILLFLFLLIPLIPLQNLADRPIEKEPDYRVEEANIEMAQFASYVNAVRARITATNRRTDNTYYSAWSDNDLESYKSSPVLRFPMAPHGTCVSRAQKATNRKVNYTSTTHARTDVDFRITWITPAIAGWKDHTKYFNEKNFAFYDSTARRIVSPSSSANNTYLNSTWFNEIALCQNLTRDSYLFIVELTK